MKKLFQLFLCVGILCTMFGCSKPKVDDEAIDRLLPAIKSMKDYKSFDYTVGFEALSMNASGTLSGSCIFDKNQYSLAIDFDIPGQTIQKLGEVYILDDMTYANILGQKGKQKLEIKDFSFGFDLDTIGFSKEEMKKSLKAASIDGNKLHFEVKDELIKDSMDQGNFNFEDANIQEITGFAMDVELENDSMSGLSLTFEGLSDGKETSISLYVTLKNINKKESIDFPKDMKDWPLKEGSLIGD